MKETKLLINRWFNQHLDIIEELHDELLVTGTEDSTYANDEELIEAIKGAMQNLIAELNAIQT